MLVKMFCGVGVKLFRVHFVLLSVQVLLISVYQQSLELERSLYSDMLVFFVYMRHQFCLMHGVYLPREKDFIKGTILNRFCFKKKISTLMIVGPNTI